LAARADGSKRFVAIWMERNSLKSLFVPWSDGQFADFGQNSTIFESRNRNSLLNSLFCVLSENSQIAF